MEEVASENGVPLKKMEHAIVIDSSVENEIVMLDSTIQEASHGIDSLVQDSILVQEEVVIDTTSLEE